MRRGTLSLIFLFLALSATAFPGCAWLSRTFHPAPPPAPSPAPPAPSPTPPTPPPAPPAIPPEISASDKLFAEGIKAMEEGGQERALELFSEAWKGKPGHAGIAREFDGALIALKKNGDAAYDQGKWENAGKRWMGTLRFITHPAANARGYPFTRSEVKSKVDRLSASLMEKALTEYRQGGVESAIAGWKTILSYDPAHEEAAQSLRTAAKQLETLKNLPPGK